MKKALLSWSSGKDSAWSLQLLRDSDYEIVGLLTTVNQAANRVAMHAVRHVLLEAQAASLGIPLWSIPLPWPCSNDQYEAIMTDVNRRAVEQGVEAVAFGDLFLRDIREYRERMLRGTGLQPIFPLWDIPTGRLARQMIAGGLRARLTCVDTRVLPASFAGREFDLAMLADLPAGVDPCGENGEFHSFVYDGPMFHFPIPIQPGETRQSPPFLFADLLPAQVGQASSLRGASAPHISG